MPVNWISTKYPNVRYYEHSDRKTRNGQTDKYYTIRYYSEGRQKEEGLGWATEGWSAEKASGILKSIKESLRLGTGPASVADMRREGEERRKAKEAQRKREDAAKMTLRDFLEGIYIPRVRKEKRSWGDDDCRIKKSILPELGDMPLCAITSEHVQAFLDKAGKTYSPASVRHFMAILRRAFNVATQSSIEGVPLFVGQNPAASSRLNLPQVFNARERFFTQKEAAALIKLAREKAEKGRGPDPLKLHDAIILSLYAGLRVSEALRLQWTDVDLTHGFVSVRKEDKRKPGGTVPLNAMALTVLERRHQERGESLLVFEDGGDFSHTFKELIDELGLNLGIHDTKHRLVFHSLRHTFASWLALAGTDIYRIKELMRHKTITMTMRYAHLIPDAMREAVHKLPPIGD